MKKVVVIGAGFAGATISRKLAEAGYEIDVYERRAQIAGNAYDYKDKSESYIHQYGPHIFHTNNKTVFDFLSNYTDWFKYEHKVLGQIDGRLVPIPFSLKSLEMVFPSDKAKKLKKKLISKYGEGNKVTISELRKENDEDLNKLSDFIYEKVFLHYTEKQWGLSPEELGNQVTGRVPIYVSYDERYFQDEYQFMPKKGYTELFNNMFNHPNIKLHLNVEIMDEIDIKNNTVYFKKDSNILLIYTGCIDELFKYKHGELEYRSLDFEFSQIFQKQYQPVGVVNYPNDYNFTRITEFKNFTQENIESNITTIVKEYPCKYEKGKIPYYPIPLKKCEEKYSLYKKEADEIGNLKLIGRLAEYKYYNMDLVVQSALDLADKIIEEENK